jgi:hypothetical protein
METLKRDFLKLVSRDSRPPSGCYACGSKEHRFGEGCPKIEQVKRKVEALKRKDEY